MTGKNTIYYIIARMTVPHSFFLILESTKYFFHFAKYFLQVPVQPIEPPSLDTQYSTIHKSPSRRKSRAMARSVPGTLDRSAMATVFCYFENNVHLYKDICNIAKFRRLFQTYYKLKEMPQLENPNSLTLTYL